MALPSLDRRRFLALTGGPLGTVMAPQLTGTETEAQAVDLDPKPFAVSVAWGEPDHESVILWTRLCPDPLNTEPRGMPAASVPVHWALARDEDFKHILRSGEVTAAPESAHTVHVLAEGLQADRWYWYRFKADGVYSRTGRTGTLPAPRAEADRMRFAFVSCQAWTGGPYPAHRDLAEQDVYFVVHLGDYIYETSKGSLTEFRRLYAQYKMSPVRDRHGRGPGRLHPHRAVGRNDRTRPPDVRPRL